MGAPSRFSARPSTANDESSLLIGVFSLYLRVRKFHALEYALVPLALDALTCQ